jgi:hypothetical protein
MDLLLALCSVQLLMATHGGRLRLQLLVRALREKTWLKSRHITPSPAKNLCEYYSSFKILNKFELFLKFRIDVHSILYRCQGFIVPELKDGCTAEPLAGKVHIHAKKGAVWVISTVKGKKDTYTIRDVSLTSTITLINYFRIGYSTTIWRRSPRHL